MKNKFVIITLLLTAVLAVFLYQNNSFKVSDKVSDIAKNANDGGILNAPHALSIESLRQGEYPGSELKIEQTLEPGVNYSRYVASYKSEGLKIYGLLTIPREQKPEAGFPVIIFNHGYIPPAEYRTTEKYVSYQAGFASNGYITFKSDYRGHGNSEGEAIGGYGSNSYTIDVLNGMASVLKLKEADKNNLGMWGHSMGGFITLRSMVANKNIKAAVLWAGVVGSYDDLLNNWRRRPIPLPSGINRSWRQTLVQEYGTPDKNPAFWNSISANAYLFDVSGPIQIHHGTNDTSVPIEFSEKLDEQLKKAGKTSELYKYEGDDHNLAANFNIAMDRSIKFFDRYLKPN
jgi:dipeptidyl aminopeptidase/acylaminoacyl peptidase